MLGAAPLQRGPFDGRRIQARRHGLAFGGADNDRAGAGRIRLKLVLRAGIDLVEEEGAGIDERAAIVLVIEAAVAGLKSGADVVVVARSAEFGGAEAHLQ